LWCARRPILFTKGQISFVVRHALVYLSATGHIFHLWCVVRQGQRWGLESPLDNGNAILFALLRP
jgi:hypothetical protein